MINTIMFITDVKAKEYTIKIGSITILCINEKKAKELYNLLINQSNYLIKSAS